MMIRILQNPLLIKLGATVVLLVALIMMVFLIIRQLRKELVSSEGLNQSNRVANDGTAFALAAYDGVIRKLKEQEKELERLRRSERDQANESASMSAAVLTNLGSGVLLFNTASLVRQANPSAKTLLGYASVFGLHARDIFRGVSKVRLPQLPAASSAPSETGQDGIDWSAEGPAPLMRAIEVCIKSGTSFRRIEADYKTPAGEPRVLGITVSPVRGTSGETLGAAGLLSDLTEITHLSQQIRLQESMAALGEMSAGIAHEFKNSLATISGYAQMLQKEPVTNTAQEFAGKISTETASLARIVNDFLNFARPQGLERELLELRSMLEDCAQEAHLDLNTDDCPAEIRVMGDPTALRQAFSNLLRNSAEAARPGCSPKVTIVAKANPTSTTLAMTDNGTGISADQLSRVFIPFFTTKPEGTGLGLALVHRIITEHGGAISVASDASGTTFTLTFPPSLSKANHANIAAKPE